MNETYVSICGYTIVGQLQKQAVTSNAIRCQSECHFVNFHSGQGRRPRFRFVLRRINWPFVKCFEYRHKFTTKVHRVYQFFIVKPRRSWRFRRSYRTESFLCQSKNSRTIGSEYFNDWSKKNIVRMYLIVEKKKRISKLWQF